MRYLLGFRKLPIGLMLILGLAALVLGGRSSTGEPRDGWVPVVQTTTTGATGGQATTGGGTTSTTGATGGTTGHSPVTEKLPNGTSVTVYYVDPTASYPIDLKVIGLYTTQPFTAGWNDKLYTVNGTQPPKHTGDKYVHVSNISTSSTDPTFWENPNLAGTFTVDALPANTFVGIGFSFVDTQNKDEWDTSSVDTLYVTTNANLLAWTAPPARHKHHHRIKRHHRHRRRVLYRHHHRHHRHGVRHHWGHRKETTKPSRPAPKAMAKSKK
jgi:hypothetical protein